MITFISKKVDEKGYCKVWNYVLNDCVKKQENLCIKYGNETMTIPWNKIKTKALKWDSKIYKSKFPLGKIKEYTVYHFNWIPDTKINKELF